MTNETTRTSLLDRVRTVVYESLLVLCGGGNWDRQELYKLSQSSVSVSNNINILDTFWDVQVRVAPALYHRYRQSNTLHITSDLGLTRTIHSPQELGQLLCLQIEPYLVKCDVRCNRSGILCIVTPERSQALRVQADRAPCPHCTHWCKGSKGLWWHVQQQHLTKHSQAVASRNSDDSLALVVYQEEPQIQILPVQDTTSTIKQSIEDDPFDHVKRGDLAALQKCLHDSNNDFDPTTAVDHRGASLLHWAAGGGHLEIVQYLIQTCGCDPEWKQQGRRAFAGRTALHWACRKGHFAVVEYLVETCHVNMEAMTTDGTTAFCWASWQAHRHIMEYLVEQGQCRVDATNVYQCNAALWAAQGEGDQATMEWLESVGCPIYHINSNGHGILHKAAQRGRRDICEWFLEKLLLTNDTIIKLPLIGPDTEHHTPSDLAGMEDHEELAFWIALQEIRVVQKASQSPNFLSPSWLVSSSSSSSSVVFADNVWEAYGGVRRMQAALRLARSSQNKDGTLVSASNPHCVINVARS